MSESLKSLKCETCPARQHSAFRNVGASGTANLDQLKVMATIKADSEIPHSLTGQEGFCCIQEGSAEVHAKSGVHRISVRTCGPGDLIGFASSSEEFGATALETSTVCFFPLKKFSHLQRDNIEIATGLIQSLSALLRRQSHQSLALAGLTVKGRVSHALLETARRGGLGPGARVKVARTTLAELSGTVTETLARALTELQNQGLIRRDGRDIVICDHFALEREAQIKDR